MMESRVDTQARRPSLASVVGTRERERREIPHDVSSDPARQRLHFDPAKPCLGRAGRECPGSRKRRLEADVGDVPGRVPVRRCDRESRIPGSSRIIPAYPGLKLLIDLTVRAPAGLGLTVMAGDYIPLLFGTEFSPAVPLVWLLAGLMYATTAFNLSGIVLSIDEQYRAIAWVRAPALLAVPLFLLASARGGLVLASFVFGATGLSIELLSYALCRRLYGFRFPWMFAARVGVVSVTMAGALAFARTLWTTSLVEALTLTAAGAGIFLVGLRLNRVFKADELSLLRQSEVPGHTWLVNWLAADREDRSTTGEEQD